MMENCSEGYPTFANFDDWFKHMYYSHNRRWHQRTFLTQGWGCAVCDLDEVYTTREALHVHLKESHAERFTPEQLEVISRQGLMERPRPWNECLLCNFTVDQVQEQNAPVFPKRQSDEPFQGGNAKMARMTLEMRSPNPHRMANKTQKDSSDSDSDSDSSSDGSRMPTAGDSNNARIMARHISGHLQLLMLLTIRFASVSDSGSTPGDDGDNDSVDMDESGSSVGTKDIGKISDIASIDDVEMMDNDAFLQQPEDIPPDAVMMDPPEFRLFVDDVEASEKDPVLSYADQFYRERRIATKIMEEQLRSRQSGEDGLGQSVLDRWNEEPQDAIPGVAMPPDMPPRRSEYDGPNADVEFDNRILWKAAKEWVFQLGGQPPFDAVKDPSCERERPMLILTVPSPPLPATVSSLAVSEYGY